MSKQSFPLLPYLVLTNKRHLWKTGPPLFRCLRWTEDLQESRRCRSLARAAHQRCSWANIFPERTVVFSASCVATAAPKAVIAIAGTDNTTWHHNFKFQSKPLYHQQRGQHSHLADMGVFHWWLHISFKAFSSVNPASWLCSCLQRAREQGTKKLYWKPNRATAAFLNSWPAAEGETHTGVLSHPR